MLHVVADQFCMSKCTFSRSSFLRLRVRDTNIQKFLYRGYKLVRERIRDNLHAVRITLKLSESTINIGVNNIKSDMHF